jgi:hypothetical protein
MYMLIYPNHASQWRYTSELDISDQPCGNLGACSWGRQVPINFSVPVRRCSPSKRGSNHWGPSNSHSNPLWDYIYTHTRSKWSNIIIHANGNNGVIFFISMYNIVCTTNHWPQIGASLPSSKALEGKQYYNKLKLPKSCHYKWWEFSIHIGHLSPDLDTTRWLNS